ncbi:MAG: cysteine dioxygenase [Pseudomonadota bacterium]|nr:cysteine dioxygenase [Pseudomonadota bacterium]
MPRPDRLRSFVQHMTRLVERTNDEAVILEEGTSLLSNLVAVDDWLPDQFAEPNPEIYSQYLLYCDPLERFSVVSFVWGPGQRTPVHDHMVWGLIGMLRGSERARGFFRNGDGNLEIGDEEMLRPGQVSAVSPRIGDVHEVSNALTDRASISIHIYGANIGAVSRHVFDADTGVAKPFVSGYSNTVVPNLWDRSEEVRAGI